MACLWGWGGNVKIERWSNQSFWDIGVISGVFRGKVRKKYDSVKCGVLVG